MAVPKFITNNMKGGYVGGPATPARRCYVGGTLVYQGFGPATEQEFIQQTAAGGPAQLLKCYGKTIVNNQLGKARNSAAEVYGITRTKVDELTIHYSGTSSRTTTFTGTENIYFTQGHKYYCAVNAVPTGCAIAGVVSFAAKSIIFSYTAASAYNNLGLSVPIGVQVDDDVQFYVIDLTLRFGAGSEPSSVDEALRLLGGDAFNPAYDPGSLQSNKTSELRAYNGDTLRGSLALNLATLTSGGVVVFPDGMRSVGSIRDEAEGSTAIKRITRVDLSTLPWAAISSPASHIFRIYRTDLPEAIKPPVNDNALANAYILGYKQLGFSPISASDDMCFAVGETDRIVIINHACSTIAQFEAAVAGLYMYYELATPQTYTLDTPLPTDLTCEQGDILQRVSDNNCPFVGEMRFGL